jgi:hypothetical protein
VEFIGDRRSLANTVTCPLHGIAHGLQMPTGDGRNLIEREALNPIKEKGFAVGAVGATKRGLHQGDHFVGVGRLFGSGETAIWNRALSRPTLVRLMELQVEFVGSLYVLAAAAVREANGVVEFLVARRHLVHGVQRKTIEPGFEVEFFRAILVAESASDHFVDNLGGGKAILGNLFDGPAEVEFAIDKALEPRKIGINIGADVVG